VLQDLRGIACDPVIFLPRGILRPVNSPGWAAKKLRLAKDTSGCARVSASAAAAAALRLLEFAQGTFGGAPMDAELALSSFQHAQGAVERALAPSEFALALTQFARTSAEFALASAELAPATL
jgi:hypothetical protein